MAHAIVLGGLADEIVACLTPYSAQTKPEQFKKQRDSALRIIRSQRFARTNHFDVEKSLKGLEEKYRVYCKDSLADALSKRLEEFEKSSTKWNPEILHFLLELSDQPVIKTHLDALDFLKPLEEHPNPVLRWEDLVAEDPLLREKAIWRNVDYGVDSSDDDAGSIDSNHDISSLTENTVLSSVGDEGSNQLEVYAVTPDLEGLQLLLKSQYWIRDEKADETKHRFEIFPENNVFITELQALREVVFMLSGLPTSMFQVEKDNISPSKDYRLVGLSPAAFRSILSDFAAQGTSVSGLRRWCRQKQSVPLLQTFQDKILAQIRQLDMRLSKLQQKYMALSNDVVVSLIQVKAELEADLRLLERLFGVISILIKEPYSHGFRCLELLYDEACLSQMAGDEGLFRSIGTMFFDCFHNYMHPIRNWMEDGELRANDTVFFVTTVLDQNNLALLWKEKYKLRKTVDGTLHAPRFIHTTAAKVFTTGKSVVVLKELHRAGRLKAYRVVEPKFDFETVCNPAPEKSAASLAPFSELFDAAFEDWIQSKHRAASLQLHLFLYNECGLAESLEAMKNIYFMADGANADLFSSAIFDKLNSGLKAWNDPFSLTETAQITFGTTAGIQAEKVRVLVSTADKHNSIRKARSTVTVLSTIRISLVRPWPVQIIISEDSIPRYQAMFTFLLQIRRARYNLDRLQLRNDPLSAYGSADERFLYYGLRSRLLWFTANIYNYLTDLVIRNNISRMHDELRKTEDVEQMILVHNTYIRSLSDQGLLGTRLEPIHNTVIAILDISLRLSNARALQSYNSGAITTARESSYVRDTRSPHWRASSSDSDSDVASEDGAADDIINSSSAMTYIDNLKNMKDQFDHLCKFLISGLKGVARAGGRPEWDMLAEKLENGLGRSAL